MKNSKLTLYFLFVIFFFSACKEEPLLEPQNKETEIVAGEYYLNLSLGTVDSFGTRGADGYDSGTEKDEKDQFVTHEGFDYESTILNGRVYLYEGTDESDAICVSYGVLDVQNKILSSGQFSTDWLPCKNIKLEKFEYDPTKTYFALVILNYNDDFIFPDHNDGEGFIDWSITPQNSNMLIENGVYKHPNNKDTQGQIKEYPAYYPTMINATGQVGYSSSSLFKPKTLVKVDPDDLSLIEKSNENIKTKIFVQRNVARVLLQPELKYGGNNLDYDKKKVRIGNSEEFWEAEVNILNWVLDVTNKTSFPVMNITGLTWDKSYWHLGNSEYERAIWAIDPNYDNTEIKNSSFNRAVLGSGWTDSRCPLYCLENTFNTECMLQGQTTRLIMRGRWAWDDKAVSEDGSQGGYLGNMDENHPCWESINSTYANGNKIGFYIIANQDKLWCRYHIEEALKEKANEIYDNITDLKINWKNQFSGGYFTLKGLMTITKGNDDNSIEIPDDDYNKLALGLGLKDASSDSSISYYYNGVQFYVVRIPHFYESDVPWDKSTEVKTKADGTFIADYNSKHLGRYGVVRNFSYVVTVNGIHSLGYPKIPDIIDDDTDDMPEDMYLDVDIKVLSWAKHDITVSF